MVPIIWSSYLKRSPYLSLQKNYIAVIKLNKQFFSSQSYTFWTRVNSFVHEKSLYKSTEASKSSQSIRVNFCINIKFGEIFQFNMSSLVPGFANELFDKIAQENGFSDFSMKIEPGSLPGDGFNSDIYSIKITENGSSKKLDLLSKIAPSSAARRKEFLSDELFKRESLFYSTFVPMLEKFQEEKKLSEEDQFHAFPKCYGAIVDSEREEYIIVLEDLRTLNFKMWDKSKPSPIENVRIAVRELGKFHGFSVALKNQKPTEFKVFKVFANLIPKFLQHKSTLEMIENSFLKAAETLENKDHQKIALHIKNNLMKYISHCFSETAGEHVGVFSHGIQVYFFHKIKLFPNIHDSYTWKSHIYRRLLEQQFFVSF